MSATAAPALFSVARADRSVCSAAAASLFWSAVCVCVYMTARVCLVYVWLAREPADSKITQGGANQQERQAEAEQAARERSASNCTQREMVTSTPGILLLPMLICLQLCANVHGKSRLSSMCVCVC